MVRGLKIPCAALLLGLVCGASQAQLRYGQPLSPTVLEYAEADVGLPTRYRKLLDEQISQLKASPACKDWPQRVDVFLVYGTDYKATGRHDYQRMGERTEALRAYFTQGQGLNRVGVQIGVESRQYLGYGSEIANVFVQCMP